MRGLFWRSVLVCLVVDWVFRAPRGSRRTEPYTKLQTEAGARATWAQVLRRIRVARPARVGAWAVQLGATENSAMNLGRWLIMIGVGFVAVGLLVMLGSKLGLPRLGRLPGDIVYRGKSTVVYFPIVTSIILSIVLTLILSFFLRSR